MIEDIQKPELEKKNDNLFKKENLYLLAFSVALGILFDILFYKKPLGISYPLYVIIFYCLLLWNMKDSLEFTFDFKWLLSIPIIALSFTYLIFSNMVFRVLNFMAIPILIVAHTILLTSNNRYKWYESGFIKDLLYGMLVRPLENIIKPFSIIAVLFKRKSEPGKLAVAGKALLGILISIPLVAVILSLLASADEVFSHFIEQIPNIFDILSFNEFIGRTILVIMVTCVLFSYLWSLINPKIKTGLNNQEGVCLLKGFLDPITVITILIMVNFIYIIFTFIQFSYLFGNLSIGLPENFTYAQYARRGFFELIAVTMINLAILLGNINFMKMASARALKVVKILNSVLVVCTLIMLVSAHFRMSMYEEAYGYTYLRVLTHLFMLYLFILLAVTLYKIWVEKVYLLKAYIVISLIAYTMVNYVNIDSIIVKNNIERYKKENRIDIAYLSSLSYDAVPYLTDLLEDGIDEESANQLKNVLQQKKERLAKVRSWQAFNFSEYIAGKELEKLESKD